MVISRFLNSTKFFRWLDTLFGIDVRSLALARVSLGLVLLLDLAVRAISLTDHYGDGGVLPSFAVPDFWKEDWWWSLHLWEGGPPYILISLFVIHALAAIFLVIGYRTRIVTIISWFLIVSLHNANPFVLYGGDILLRVVLFVGIFLPWGATFSVDQVLRHQKPSSKRVLSGWAAAYLVQLGFLYFFAAEFKSGSEWLRGEAIYYALSFDYYVTHFGKLLLGLPHLLTYLTYGVLALEYLAIVFLFFPIFTIPLRLIALILLIVMHLGLALTLNIGLFSWIVIAALMAFIPSATWDALSRLLQKSFGRITIYYDGECNFCRTTVWFIYTFLAFSTSSIKKAQEDPRALKEMRARNSWVVKDSKGLQHVGFDAFVVILGASPFLFFVAPLFKISAVSHIGGRLYNFISLRRSYVCLPEVAQTTQRFPRIGAIGGTVLGLSYIVYIFLWQVPGSPRLRTYISPLPSGWDTPAKILRIDQYWNMFSPSPSKIDGWPVIPGKLHSGREVDLARNGQVVSFEKPQHVVDLYPTVRWQKYLENLWINREAPYLKYYAIYLCNAWNRNHSESESLKSLEIIAMIENTPPPGSPSPQAEPVSLITWVCE